MTPSDAFTVGLTVVWVVMLVAFFVREWRAIGRRQREREREDDMWWPPSPVTRLPRGRCPHCDRDVALRNGTPVPHHCAGPRPAPPPPPPPSRGVETRVRVSDSMVIVVAGELTEEQVARVRARWEQEVAGRPAGRVAPPKAEDLERAIYLREEEKTNKNG